MIPPPDVLLRAAVAGDIPFLETLREITLRGVVTHHHPWDDGAQRERVLVHFDSAKIIRVGNKDAGLLKFVENETEIELTQIQLLPEFQSQGIGSHLIGMILDQARKTRRSVWLDVYRSSRAVPLYRRLGFCVEEEDEYSFTMRWSPDFLKI